MLFISIMIVCIFLIMNINSKNTFQNKIITQIETDKQTINDTKRKISELTKDSEDYKFGDELIQSTEVNITTYNEILKLYENKNWSKMYEKYRDVLLEQKKINENTMKVTKNQDTSLGKMSDFVDQQLAYITYLKNHNLAYENPDFPIFGLTFLTSMLQSILPILITICCIYVLTQIFTADYLKGVDTSRLLPIRKKNIFLSKIAVGIGVSLCILLIIITMTFLLASVFNENTGFDYPIMIKNIQNGSWLAVKASFLFRNWLFLSILYYVCICFFIYFLSLFIKEDMPLIFITLCFIIGMAYLPTIINFLQPIAHILPTTYMNSVNVVNENLAIQYHNSKISTTNGIQVLSLAIGIQFVFCFIRNTLHKSRFNVFEKNQNDCKR